MHQFPLTHCVSTGSIRSRWKNSKSFSCVRNTEGYTVANLVHARDVTCLFWEYIVQSSQITILVGDISHRGYGLAYCVPYPFALSRVLSARLSCVVCVLLFPSRIKIKDQIRLIVKSTRKVKRVSPGDSGSLVLAKYKNKLYVVGILRGGRIDIGDIAWVCPWWHFILNLDPVAASASSHISSHASSDQSPTAPSSRLKFAGGAVLVTIVAAGVAKLMYFL